MTLSNLVAAVACVVASGCASSAPLEHPVYHSDPVSQAPLADDITTVGRPGGSLVVVNRGTAHAVILLDGEQVETKAHDNAVWRVDGRVIRMQFLDMSQACATSPRGILEDAVRGLSAVVAHEQELQTRWAHYDDGSSFVALLVRWSDPGVPPVAVAATVVGDQVVMLASAVPEDDWRPVAERLFHMILTTRVSAGWIDPSAPLSPLRRQLPVEPQALPAGCAGCTASLFAP